MAKELVQTWKEFMRIFVCPRNRYNARIWGRVQAFMWSAVDLFLLWLVLPWVVQLVKVLR